MKIDALIRGGPAEAPDEAAAAQAAGFDGLHSAEVQHDPFLLLARAVGAAPGLEFGTSIAVAFARSPMTVAYSAWDLQALTGGRFYLGLGSQVKAHIERRFSMPWSQPAARMREYVLALRAIWRSWQDGDRLEFDGEFYRHTLMTPMFSPGRLESGPPRVLLAAVGDTMTRVAGEVADGLIVHSFTTRRYIREVTLPTLGQGLTRCGRAREDFELVYAPFVVTGADEAAMAASAAVARERIAFYASTPAYRPVLELHGWGDLQVELNAAARRGEWQAMGRLIDDTMLGEFAVIAPPDELAVAYARWVGGLADRTGFTPPESMDINATGELLASIRSSAAEVTASAAAREVLT